MTWQSFIDSVRAWRSVAEVPFAAEREAFAAYLAARHDLTAREAAEAIEDWVTLAGGRVLA